MVSSCHVSELFYWWWAVWAEAGQPVPCLSSSSGRQWAKEAAVSELSLSKTQPSQVRIKHLETCSNVQTVPTSPLQCGSGAVISGALLAACWETGFAEAGCPRWTSTVIPVWNHQPFSTSHHCKAEVEDDWLSPPPSASSPQSQNFHLTQTLHPDRGKGSLKGSS